MSTFVLIHGAGDGGAYWQLVAAQLRARGHEVVAPDLPAGDDALGLDDYADAVVAAVGDRRDLVVVGQSFGGFTAPLVAVRLPVDALVLVAGMIPTPGEAPGEWWARTGYREAVERQAARDGGLTGHDDPLVAFYHDVPHELAVQAMRHARSHPSRASMAAPWPLRAWPDVPTHFVLCTEDRFLPPDFARRLVADRLGIVPDEIAAGHCVALSRPQALADLLERHAADARPRPRLADHYDVELRAHHERLCAALEIRATDRVLDVGCGTGQLTRHVARAASRGHVVGIDVSDAMLDVARRRNAEASLDHVELLHADAQRHPFPAAHFDAIVSRFGTMFFADPAAAFAHLAAAARPDARLAMMVWQREADNAWATEIRDALDGPGGTPAPKPPAGLDPFSLAEPATIRTVLDAAGFVAIELHDIEAPVDYGPDVSTALCLVRDMKHVRDALAGMPAAQAERALARLRDTLHAHATPDGVPFDSRAWLVTARRAPS